MEITSKKEAPLLSRLEIGAEIGFESSTPSNKDVLKEIGSKLKVEESLIRIKSIYTNFGRKKAKVSAYIYSSKENMEKIEGKPRKQRRLEKEAALKAKQGEAAQEEKKETPAAK